MKTIFLIVLFAIIAVFPLSADDWESYDLISRLLTLPEPGFPIIHENSVIFTAPSSLRRVGVAFANENFSPIYWFSRLLISQDPLDAPIPPGQKFPDPYKDSGLQFYVYKVPENVNELEYRLIVNGLWTVDPINPRTRKDPASGLVWSVLPIPRRAPIFDPLKGLPKGLNFSFPRTAGRNRYDSGRF